MNLSTHVPTYHSVNLNINQNKITQLITVQIKQRNKTKIYNTFNHSISFDS